MNCMHCSPIVTTKAKHTLTRQLLYILYAHAQVKPSASRPDTWMSKGQPSSSKTLTSSHTLSAGALSAVGAADDSVIEATSQLSRFHLETLTVTANKALQLQTVNLSVNNKQLLSDAVLSLQPGVRYGLIGK